MRKLKLFSVLMCLFIGIGQMWGTVSWTRVTDVSDLTSGGTFIIGYEATANSGVIIPMANTGSASTTAAGFIYSGSTASSGGNGTINMSTVTATSNYEVTIVSSGEGKIAIKLGTNFLGNANTKNNAKLFTADAAANGTSLTPTIGTNDVVSLKNANATYHTLQYNTGSPRFAFYGGGQKNLVIYKKSESGPANPTVSTDPTSLTFDAAEVGGSAPSAKTFTISGSNLTSALTVASSNTNLYACAVTSGSLTPSSKSVTATITVTPQAAITESAGTKEANIVISGGGLTSSVNVALSTTVTAPAHVYTYNKAFSSTTILDWSSWGGYAAHTVNFDLYNGHTGNDCHVNFASASKQSGTITDKPVAKDGAVNLILDDPNKYISAVKFVGEQWGTKAQTMVLKYSTDGGDNWTAFDPAKEATNFVIEELNLPAKVNAVQVAGKNSSNQIGYASVHFDLVDKVTYSIGKDETGCTLSVTDGTSAITSAEEGDEVYVSIATTEEGYENASFVVKDAENNTITVTAGKFTMPDKNVTITATATKKQYIVTLSATNGKIQVGGVDKESITVAHGETAELTAVANTDYAFNGWTSNSANVVLTDAALNPATITVTGAGTITANFISTTKADPEISWSADLAEVVKGQILSLPTFSNPHTLNVAYSSTDEGVAEISNAGNVTINGVGTTTIKATFTENEDYAGKEVSYTLTVKGRVTWHIIKEGVDATSYADYEKDAVPTKPLEVTSCDDASISLVGWTNAPYTKSDVEPTPLYKENVPAVADNADYYAVWATVEEGGWNEITSVPTAGTYAIYAAGYFLKAEISDKNRFNNGNDGTNIVSDGKLTTVPAADCQWEISINAGGKFLLKNGTNYAGAPDEKNKGALLTDNTSAFAQWEITYGTGYVVKNVGRAASSTNPNNAYLRQNGANGWATYASSTGDAPRFFKYSAGSATGYTTNCVPPMTVATPTFSPDGSAAYYTEAQTVEISCATAGATIYYSLDGSEPSVEYTAPISIGETKTLKAKAVLEDISSEIAEATFTINLPLTTIPAIFNAATTTSTTKMITFDNWVVSGVKADGTQAFLTDGTNGIILFHKNVDMQLEVGNTLSGTKECSLILFSGAAELQDFSTDGLTVGTNGEVNPVSKSISELSGVNTGAPVIISNVTYNSTNSTLVDEGENAIKPYTTLYDYESTFVNNKIYTVTGIYLQFGNTKELLPRQSEDIVLESKEQPTLKWYVNNTKETEIGATYTINKDDVFAPYFESNSDGAKTYSSTVGTVASIDPSTGALSIEGVGETVISCAVEADGDFLAGSKSFTLKVRAEGSGDATWVAATWAAEEEVASNTKMAVKSPIAIDANLSMTWSKAEGSNDPIYHSDGEGRLYQKNTLAITASNSKQITRIEFHFKTGYAGTISADAGIFENGVWTGFAPSVTFTNAASASQARIQSIDIEYAQGTTTTLVIEDMIILEDASATDIVFTSNKPGAVVTYSDYDEDVITIAEGKVTPVAIGNTTVKASIAAEAPYSSVSITFNVRVKSSSETVENVVILSQFGEGWIAMKHDFTAVEVEKAADGTILDLTCDEEDITWVMTADGTSAMFQQPSTNKYLAVGSSNALVLSDDATVWTLSDDGYYYNVSGRTFLYQGTGAIYKNYAASNAGSDAQGGYSEYATFVAPVFANRAEIRTSGISSGVWGTICPKKEVKYPTGASFFQISYVEYHSGVPYKVFYDEIAEGASLEAGHPYLFQADEESTAIKGIAAGDDATSAISDHGFKGVLENETINVVSADVDAYRYYIVYNNEIRLCGEGQFLIRAERAYLDMSDPYVEKQYKAPINGRRRVALTNNAPQVATGMENVQGDNVQCTKVLINGQLFIIRGEKMFDAKGQLVK